MGSGGMLAEEAIWPMPCRKQLVVVIFLNFLCHLVAVFDVSAGGEVVPNT